MIQAKARKFPKALCPKCGQFGFIRIMPIPSNYYPKFWSVKCSLLQEALSDSARDPSSEHCKKRVDDLRKDVRGYVKGDVSEFRISKKHLLPEDEYRETQNIKNKKSLIRVTYRRYRCLYIGHYDKVKYEKEMIRYRQGVIKSRPNGRRWCKLPRYFSRQYEMVNDSSRGKYIKFQCRIKN